MACFCMTQQKIEEEAVTLWIDWLEPSESGTGGELPILAQSSGDAHHHDFRSEQYLIII